MTTVSLVTGLDRMDGGRFFLIPQRSFDLRERRQRLPLQAARSGRGCEEGVVMRRRQQQRQHRVAGLVIKMEAVAAVAELMGDGQHVREGGALGECNRPL